MAKPRRRKRTEIPSITPNQRTGNTGANTGRARDTYVFRQTVVGGRDTGSGGGRMGSYGPNRLHGQAESRRRAQARRDYRRATIRGMDEYAESGDITRWLNYPTKSIGDRKDPPRRPRTQLAGYDGKSHTIRILFSRGEHWTAQDGAIYEYYDVPYNVWRMVKRNISTGQTINRTLNNYPYAEIRPAPRPRR